MEDKEKMILLYTLKNPKREVLCYLNQHKNVYFKKQIWKPYFPLLFQEYNHHAIINKIDYILIHDFYDSTLELLSKNAAGALDINMETFLTDINNNIAKKRKQCKDCVFKFQYELKNDCNRIYRKNTCLNPKV